VTSPQAGGLDFKALIAEAKTVNNRLALLWVGCGTDDTRFPFNKEFAGLLQSSGVEAHLPRHGPRAHVAGLAALSERGGPAAVSVIGRWVREVRPVEPTSRPAANVPVRGA
jgi:hypothetical protein